jgi:hypothetical protein
LLLARDQAFARAAAQTTIKLAASGALDHFNGYGAERGMVDHPVID